MGSGHVPWWDHIAYLVKSGSEKRFTLRYPFPLDVDIEAKGLRQITDSAAIEGVIDSVMAANPKQLGDYQSGKDKLFGFFVGQVMKATEGKANPAQLNELLKKKLGGG